MLGCWQGEARKKAQEKKKDEKKKKKNSKESKVVDAFVCVCVLCVRVCVCCCCYIYILSKTSMDKRIDKTRGKILFRFLNTTRAFL